MVPYFQKFPNTLYDFGQGNTQYVLTDIIHRARIREIVQSNTAVYYQYQVKDGETAWTIANKYYGDPRYHWVVFFSNDILDPYFDWPLGYDDFNAFMTKLFGDVPTSMSTTHHWEDGKGHWIDQITFNLGIIPGQIAISNYDYYFGLNESKRSIQLLDRSWLAQIDQELDELLQSVSS